MKIKYGYVETSNVKATRCGNVFSVKADVPLQNGTLMKLHSNIKGMLHVREVKPANDTDKVVLICSVLTDKGAKVDSEMQEVYLRKEAGEIGRAFELVTDDEFAIHERMIKVTANDKVEVGNYVILDVTTSMYKAVFKANVATELNKKSFVAEIISVEPHVDDTLVRLRVIQNKDK